MSLALAATRASPAVTTAAATNVTDTGAVLHGTVNPEGHQTQYAFQSGPTAGYGHNTPLSSAGAGSSAFAISATPSGLAPAARITSGRSRSMLRAQRLSAPIGASARGARLSRRRRQRRGPPPSAGAAREHDLSLRVVAQTAGGTTDGVDRAVRTTGSSHIQSRLAVLGRMGFVSRGGWIGVVLGCFGGDTRCTGHFSLTRGHMLVAQRNFSVAPRDVGFQNCGPPTFHNVGRATSWRDGYSGPPLDETDSPV